MYSQNKKMSASTSTSTPVSTPAAAPEVSTESKKTRRVVDAESVVASFDDLQKLIEVHIESLREAAASAPKTGSTGVKFLRTVCSRVKQLKKDAVRVMEASKKRPRRAPTTNGGFLKPHHITSEMAAFAGWNTDELKSRVDVTNSICQYVKANNLYDPAKRKNILPDPKLRDLLQYDPTVAGNDPLTFFYLQKLIGKLQVKESPAAAASVKA
jgi:chromatin remodeling complex protein RSC6